jgi:hypothetical protein
MQFPSTLESTHSLHHYYSQSLFLSATVVSYHEVEGDMPTLGHNEQQQTSLYLTDGLVDHSNNEDGYDDMSSLGGQLTAMEINTPYDDWPQDPHQAQQFTDETMVAETTSFFADSSGTTDAYADPAASPYSVHSYFHGYDYYNDYDYYNEHFDSIDGTIYDFDIPMTPADYSNAANSSSSSITHPFPQQ